MSNISCYDSDGNLLETFYQWDHNQTITISGIDLQASYAFHYCNRLSKEALVVSPTKTEYGFTARVPNILLQQPESIVVYLYLISGNEEYRTEHSVHIPVVPRAKPSDYEYDDESEYISIAELDEELKALISRVDEIESGGGDGQPGFSPTITVAAITGGHRLTIIDINGTKTVNIMDGANGTTPIKGTDYFTSAEIAQVVSAAAAEVDVPTSVSDLTNDSLFISENDNAQMVPMMLSGTTVTVNMSFSTIYSLFNSAKKTYFLMPSSEYGGIVFNPTEVDISLQKIGLNAINNGILYQITLTPSGNTVSGILTQMQIPTPGDIATLQAQLNALVNGDEVSY